jgi:SAM-dependent methyltransferase
MTGPLDVDTGAMPDQLPAATGVTGGPCRFCGRQLADVFVDLGMSPLCESFLTADALNQMEPFYPLTVWVCDECLLVQVQEYVTPEEIFREYAYFSSYSAAWLEHAEKYVDGVTQRYGLGEDHLVVELASNDGYLLQYFVERGIPVLGVEPAANVADAARERGVPTRTNFFDASYARSLADEGRMADLLVANNVLAQVPDLNSFVEGMATLLAPDGVVTVEFPHLLRLIEGNQFDTIYHEHFSYFSLTTAQQIFAAHGLRLFDVEELWTHGGSLRLHACHQAATHAQSARVEALLAVEHDAGLAGIEGHRRFQPRVEATKRNLLEFLIGARREGKTVVGYGAPGKGNTLLNYCGIRADLLAFTVDRNPYKHGRYLPGTHIPVHPPEALDEARPDYVLILPWNLRDEIAGQLAHVRDWGARFVVPIPELDTF